MGTRNLYVATQVPDRGIHPIGRLQIIESEGSVEYRFDYLGAVRDIVGFEPLLSFPDLDRTYRSRSLFPMFQNRVMPKRRPDFARFMHSLRLPTDAGPFEILARNGGRATDQLEVFPEPERDPSSGIAVCRFFVRGLRYVSDVEVAISRLAEGTALNLQPEPDNPKDTKAVQVRMPNGDPLGWVPAYLTSYVRLVLDSCDPDTTRLVVEALGDPDDGWHGRVTARLESCWIGQDWPFGRAEYQPLILTGIGTTQT